MENTAWRGFARGKWSDGEIDVRDFIQRNYTPYEGDGAFLAPATEATAKLWEQVLDLSQKERARGGVYDADTAVISRVNSHKAGYFDKNLEKIVGLQTDEPFKRGLLPLRRNPHGGRIAQNVRIRAGSEGEGALQIPQDA